MEMGKKPLIATCGAALSFLLSLGLIAACGNAKVTGASTMRAEKEAASKVQSSTGQNEKEGADASPGNEVLSREVSDSGSGLQVKSIGLLRSSLRSCMGGNLTNITCDMHVQSGAGLPAACAAAGGSERLNPMNGRKPFLLPSRYPIGGDIIDIEAPNLYDPSKASRASTGADQITDSYLRALTVIADVVAHNCDTSGECDCSTEAKAQAMVKRCFPGYDPASSRVVQISTLLVQACSTPNHTQRRQAIASMLSSYAFASAR